MVMHLLIGFVFFVLFSANPIPAVTEFVAQLQILELLDNVLIHPLSLCICFFTKFLSIDLELLLYKIRQFLLLGTRLFCTSTL